MVQQHRVGAVRKGKPASKKNISNTSKEKQDPNDHRGEAVREILKELTINKAALAKKLNRDYSTIHRWLNDPELSWDIIKNIGEKINYDFTRLFKKMPVERSNQVNEDGDEDIYASLAGLSATEIKARYFKLQQKYTELVMNLGDVLQTVSIYQRKYGPLNNYQSQDVNGTKKKK